MNEFYIKQIDRLPLLYSILEDDDGVINLSSGVDSVYFIYKHYYDSSASPVTGIASVKTGTLGLVEYAWKTGDVSTPGVFWGEWRVNYNDLTSYTFPNDGYIVFEINPRIS